ncbi:alpha/beta hydrolase [Lacticaseibacillus jixianensis]|uniref:Alpha/beta hydrolase n=1 Tax=Lacticaseibacillus jixianensis TaxID=2486012 RepID=A0ABW4BAR1_9LACO|nr:alpha/beta hydrolase [Lacticaseibacillus jixianensis]
MKRRTKIWLGLLVGLLVLLAAGWGALQANTHQPTPAAVRASRAAVRTDYGLAFKAKRPAGASVIFYPGALVAPASYSIWAKQLAEAGTTVYIVQFPLNLAVLSGNKADQVLRATKGPVVIGGHSLGGVMAARYAKAHRTKRLAGVFFLASYADTKGRLTKRGVPVLAAVADHDRVLNWSAYRKAKANLPAQAQFVTLSGNHAGFGSYGKQAGDGTSPVTNAAQQRAVAKTLHRWLTTRVGKAARIAGQARH